MDKKDLYLNREPIDPRTDYGKGLEQKIDPRTDFGREITYKTCDGKDVDTMEEVIQYNQIVYDRMKNNFETKEKRIRR